MRILKLLMLCTFAMCYSDSFKNPNFAQNRTVMVLLFEWKWTDIALECERFLGPKGYAGVQVSPVTENVIIKGRPWWERYQPMSYKLITRSGNEIEFADMVRRCNAVDVRIYVDLVFNHMTGIHDSYVGTGGSTGDPITRTYPGVPFIEEHFNSPLCSINDWDNPREVRVCGYGDLRDLNQTHPYVKAKMISLMDSLIDHGVAGFRIDAAKHMWPFDLKEIYENLKPLSPLHGFQPGIKPFIYHEFIDFGAQKINHSEYIALAVDTEFRFSNEIGRVFHGWVLLKYLYNWGTGWSFLPSSDAFVFVDNHDNQRDGNQNVLSYRYGREYRMATVWALAHPYGTVRVMSSYEFESWDHDRGPPHDALDNILSPKFNEIGSCVNGWVCEHRWQTTVNMVSFRNTAGDAPISMWYDNGRNQIALSRGNRAFIAFNREYVHFDKELDTKLPAGTYCDIISGQRRNNSCTGSSIIVNKYGFARISLLPLNISPDYDAMLAIHVGSLSKLD